MAFKAGKFKPLKSIFVGTAINWGRDRGIDIEKLVTGYSVPTILIQKTSDPTCSFSELKHILENLKLEPVQLYEEVGDDHSYDDLKFLENCVRRFFTENQ